MSFNVCPSALGCIKGLGLLPRHSEVSVYGNDDASNCASLVKVRVRRCGGLLFRIGLRISWFHGENAISKE